MSDVRRLVHQVYFDDDGVLRAVSNDEPLPVTVASEYLFSEYSASLADGAEIVSPVLDMAGVDKWQGEFGSGSSGLTQVIETSNVATFDEFEITSTTTVETTFQLFNVIVRQRYLRVRWQNNTGAPVSDCYAAVKASYGSSDKLSVFPINIDPTEFSQAALTQAIGRALNPDGNYINSPAGGISSANSTQVNLPISGGFTGDYVDVRGQGHIVAFALSDQPLDDIKLQWSPDGVTPRAGLVSTSNFTSSEQEIGGFYVYLTVATTLVDNYVRLDITNGTTATTIFEADVWISPTPYAGTFLSPIDEISSLSSALFTRALQVAQQPDGDYVNTPADGNVYTHGTPLGASGTFTTEGFDTDGWKAIELYIATDQVSLQDGIVVEYTPDSQAATPVWYPGPKFTYGADAVTAGFVVKRFAPALDGFRLTYTNGGTAQGSFFLSMELKNGATEPTNTSIENDIDITQGALLMRGVDFASNDSGTYGNITRGPLGGKRVSIYEHEAETPIKPLNNLSGNATSVSSSTPTQIATGAPAGTKSVEIQADPDNAKVVYIGFNSGLTSGNAPVALQSGDARVYEVEGTPLFYALGASGSQSVRWTFIAEV